MSESKPILFFGSDGFSAAILESLLEDWPVKLVITSPRQRRGRGQRDSSHPVLDLAAKHKIDTLIPEQFDPSTPKTIQQTAAPLAVLASYGKILPQAVLDVFNLGIVNVHPSLLPRWRGPSPIEAAILAGDDKTGITLMKLTQTMDAGPVYTQAERDLGGHETQGQLYRRLAADGAALLKKELPNIVRGTTKPIPQAKDGVTYCPIIKKNDGLIDWTQPAEQIERQIRAYQDWPKARTQLLGRDVVVNAAEAMNHNSLPVEANEVQPGQIMADSKQLLIKAGEGALNITELVPAGKRPMSGSDFLRGYSRP